MRNHRIDQIDFATFHSYPGNLASFTLIGSHLYFRLASSLASPFREAFVDVKFNRNFQNQVYHLGEGPENNKIFISLVALHLPKKSPESSAFARKALLVSVED